MRGVLDKIEKKENTAACIGIIRRHGRLQGEENGSAPAIRVGGVERKREKRVMDGTGSLDCYAPDYFCDDAKQLQANGRKGQVTGTVMGCGS